MSNKPVPQQVPDRVTDAALITRIDHFAAAVSTGLLAHHGIEHEDW